MGEPVEGAFFGVDGIGDAFVGIAKKNEFVLVVGAFFFDEFVDVGEERGDGVFRGAVEEFDASLLMVVSGFFAVIVGGGAISADYSDLFGCHAL